jgi:hypothetical protein
MPRAKKGTTRVRRRKTQKGKGVMDDLKSAHNFVKSNKLISRGLSLTPFRGAAAIADMLGYGKKRASTKRRRATTTKSHRKSTRKGTRKIVIVAAPSARQRALYPAGQMGRGIFSDIGGGLGSIAHGIFG